MPGLFCFIGIYTVITWFWREYEKAFYKEIKPKLIDSLITMVAAIVVTVMIL